MKLDKLISEVLALDEKAIWTKEDNALEIINQMPELARECLKLLEENRKLTDFLKVSLPITEAAFWDHHTAGMLPGTGYNHKAEHLAGQQWGWRTSDKFSEWIKEARAALKECGEE